MAAPMKLVLSLLLCTWMAQAKVEGPFPARNGEKCVVCNTPVTTTDVAYLVDGHRVAVMKAMEEEFLRNPFQYVTKIDTGTVDLAPQQSGVLTSAYVWLGLFVLTGAMFGGVCASLAATKGCSKMQWFVLGFCFSVVALAVIARKPTAFETVE